MKLIIDIPKEVVVAIENGVDYRYDIHTAIAQGVPYEERPTGRWRKIFTSTVHMYTEYECSVCGRLVQHFEGDIRLLEVYPYCHCGADMRVKGGRE